MKTAAELQNALDAAQPNDVITMADGTYSGNFSSTANGTSTAPITLKGGPNAILDGGDMLAGYTLHLGTTNSSASVSYWNLQGFSVTGGQKGVVLDNVQHSLIDGLLIHLTGDEGIHLRDFSSDNTVSNTTVTKTGQVEQGYGEGIYVGTAISNWPNYSQGNPDHSDRNSFINNNLSYNGSENMDIKEGTHGGIIRDSRMDGTGMCWNPSVDCNYADSNIDMKGEGWTVVKNTLEHMHTVWPNGSQQNDAVQDHNIAGAESEGSGNNNIFENNVINDVEGYGFRIPGAATGIRISCNNSVTNAALGFGNIPCSP
ncbi:MAG: hypothetical protein NVSMB39_3890 [Candidatus Saccharimonadales bacterium]